MQTSGTDGELTQETHLPLPSAAFSYEKIVKGERQGKQKPAFARTWPSRSLSWRSKVVQTSGTDGELTQETHLPLPSAAFSYEKIVKGERQGKRKPAFARTWPSRILSWRSKVVQMSGTDGELTQETHPPLPSTAHPDACHACTAERGGVPGVMDGVPAHGGRPPRKTGRLTGNPIRLTETPGRLTGFTGTATRRGRTADGFANRHG